jgi:multiple sugar transport system permease protein
VWRYTGFYMLLLMVGLQGISAEVYESASLDGASRWRTFRHITLPLLRPSLALCTIMCVTGSLLAFDQFYILTKGG